MKTHRSCTAVSYACNYQSTLLVVQGFQIMKLRKSL